MEDYGYKCIQKISHFLVTMTSRNNRSIDMKPNHVNNTDFMSILYGKPLSEYKKPKFGIAMKFAFSSMIYRSEKGVNHKLHKKFLPLLLKFLQSIQSKTNKKKLYVGNSTRSNQLESFEYGLIFNRFDFQRIFTALSKQHALWIHKFLDGASDFGRTMESSIFRDFLAINLPKRHRGEIYALRWKTLRNKRRLLSSTWTVFLHNWQYGSYENSHTRKKEPQRHLYHN